MAVLNGFVGPSYSVPSLRADAQSAIGVYVETDQSGAGKTPSAMVGTPGLAKLGSALPTSPIRGLWVGENRLFVVSGSKLYEVDDTGAPINGIGGADRGDVHSDGLPAQIIPNGNQLAIASAGLLWYDNGMGVQPATGTGYAGVVWMIPATMTAPGIVLWISGDTFDATVVGKVITFTGGTANITAYISPTQLQTDWAGALDQNVAYTMPGAQIQASSLTFMDGYAIASVPNTAQFAISAINDFSSWNSLDFGVKEGYPDHILTVIATNENLYLLGSQTLEIWYDSGDANFPFTRVSGALLQVGLAAASSVDKLGTGIAFLSTDTRGGLQAVTVQGNTVTRISTYAVEQIWKTYGTTWGDCVSHSYKYGGHEFYVMNFVQGDATWVFDATENTWHQRGYQGDGFTVLATVQGTPRTVHRQATYLHGFCFGVHIVGSWSSGQLYIQSPDYLTDDGVPIVRQRAGPTLSNQNLRSFYSQFTLDQQFDTDGVTNPQFTLDWSNDGCQSFGERLTIGPQIVGDTQGRIQWRRLGKARLRTFRVTSTAAIHHAWLGAYYDKVDGTS